MAQASGAMSPSQRLRTRIAASSWAAFFGGAPRARQTTRWSLLRESINNCSAIHFVPIEENCALLCAVI